MISRNRNADKSTDVPRAKATPLPTKELAILGVVLLNESICSTMLIPFVGLYVSFMLNCSPDKAGYSAGFLIGLFMLGQVISAKTWGYMGDTYGRKFFLATGVSCSAISVFFFGLSTDIYYCAFWRFMHGLSAGSSLLAKTIIADITDTSNQSKGFVVVSLTWGIGTLIGSSVSGFLYDPVHKKFLAFLHLKEDGFWAMHPAFLPALLAFSYNVLAVTVCILYIKETNKSARPLYMMFPPKVAAFCAPLLRLVQPKLPNEHDNDANTFPGKGSVAVVVEGPEAMELHTRDLDLKDGAPGDNAGLGRSGNLHVCGCEAQETKGGHTPNRARKPLQQEALMRVTEAPVSTSPAMELPTPKLKAGKKKTLGYKQAFSNPITRKVCIISMLISGSDMIFIETLPLWMIAPYENGGLNLQAEDVSLLLITNTFPAITANLLFPHAIEWSGDQLLFWMMCQFLYAVTTFFVPCATLLPSSWAYWFIMGMVMLRKAFESWTFCLIMLTVAQTAPPQGISAMYGIQQSTSCAVRCAVPFLCTPLFAWSISTWHPYPFNHYFVFYMAVLPLCISVAVSFKIRTSNNAPVLCSDTEGLANSLQDATGCRHSDHCTDTSTPRHACRSMHAFFRLEDDEIESPTLLLRNSFTSLAHSFATNMVPGILQPTIFPLNIPDIELSIGSSCIGTAGSSDYSCQSLHTCISREENLTESHAVTMKGKKTTFESIGGAHSLTLARLSSLVVSPGNYLNPHHTPYIAEDERVENTSSDEEFLVMPASPQIRL